MTKMKKDGTPVFIEHPVFVGWITLLAQVPLQLFFTLWAGGFFSGMSSALFGFHGQSPFIVCGSAAFIGIPAVAYFGKS